MQEENERVLKLLEQGKISAEDADNLLDALNDSAESETDSYPTLPGLPTAPNMDAQRSNWRKPFNASLMTLGVSSGAFLGLRRNHGMLASVIRFVALPVMLVSAVAAVISYWSKDAPWIHVRVREHGEQQVAVSLPIPISQVRRTLAFAKDRVQDEAVAEQLEIAAEFLEAFDVRGEHDPITVNVDDDETQVELYIG